jgi:hypothetical protein
MSQLGKNGWTAELGWRDLLLHHFWSSSPNPSRQSSPESFGWWPGKVASDLRSFSQVVSGMGDGGGRGGFGSTRGCGYNNDRGGRGKMVWHHEDAPQASSNSTITSGSRDRWEKAARESELRRQEANSSASGTGISSSNKSVNPWLDFSS